MYKYRLFENELEARELAGEIAYAIAHGEPAQREFDAKASSAAVVRRAVEMAWRGQYDLAEDVRGDQEGWDVWGWTARTPQDEQEWRIFVAERSRNQ